VRARIGLAILFATALAFVTGSVPTLLAQDSAQTPATSSGQNPAPGAAQTPAANPTETPAPPPPPPPPATPVAAPTQDSTNDLTVSVGKSVVLDMAKPVTQIAVGSSEVAEAQAVSPTQVLINGKKVGETSVIVWDVSGARQFFNLTVRESTFAMNDALDSVRRQLRLELPGQSLKVSAEGGSVFLRGSVDDLNSADRAVAIASTAGKVVNLLDVTVPSSPPQILLKVRFASIDRNKSRQLGMNLFSTGFGNTVGTVTTGQFSPPSVTAPTGTSASVNLSNELNLFAFYPGINLGATIQAMEQDGLAQVLAEPNVLAEDGKQASFLAGGEYPYPIVQGATGGIAGAVTIEFKEYGVQLSFIPTITPRGTIRLQVAPEVSALDFADALTLSGFTVPAITVRRVQTEIELQDGQSFAIGGLLNNNETETFEKIPFLGDIPILGKFFRSKSTNRTNTELVVIVTPEIVSPIPAGQSFPDLKYGQKFLPPQSGFPMHTPDAKTPENTLPPAPATMPVEKLQEFMKKPEPKLKVDDSFGSGGSGSSGGSSSSGP
jgi:pilus assembly protein CpaC